MKRLSLVVAVISGVLSMQSAYAASVTANSAVPLSGSEIRLLAQSETSNPGLLDRRGAGCITVRERHGRIAQDCATPLGSFVAGCPVGLVLGALAGSFWGVYWAAVDAGAGCTITGALNYFDESSVHSNEPDWQ